MSEQEQNGGGLKERLRKSIILCAIIVFVSFALIGIIKLTEPSAQKSNDMRKSAALVEVVEAVRGDFSPEIVTLGTVQPAQDVMLRARVPGYVMDIAKAFEPGALVDEGEVLITLDTRDYEIARMLRKSELEVAEAALEVERGQQAVARAEYELSGETLIPDQQALVLREPQLNSAQAHVSSARADYEQAVVNLERTAVRVPFNAKILDRRVNTGSMIATSEPLARLVGTDEFWVVATVSAAELRWLSFSQDEDNSSSVRLHQRGAWDSGEYRQGLLLALVGELDQRSKLAKVLISVNDPLALKTEAPILLVGSMVEAVIKGKVLHDVVRVERDYLRQGDRLWVMKDAKLSIRDVTVVFSDANYVYLSAGVEAGELIITTNLATAKEGIPLQLTAESSEAKP